MKQRFEYQINETFHKKRLDEFLFNEFTKLSKAYLRRVVKEGNCVINGFVANTGIQLKRLDFVEIEVDINQAKGMTSEKIPLNIVYEDNEIIVINKEAGILVHPTNYERNGTLLNGLAYYLNKNRNGNLFIRPHLIHRLDRETSGLILIAKNQKVSKSLCNHFRRKLFDKKYLAIVEGVVKEDFGEINAPISRNAEMRKWEVNKDGKVSQTKFKVIKRYIDKTLLELEPVTGRTNQLRIHCDFIGHPIIGDTLHSKNVNSRLCLHASNLHFWHPNGNKRMKFECDMPVSMKEVIKSVNED